MKVFRRRISEFLSEHQNEPYPLELLEILKRFSKEPEPFVWI